MVKKFWVIKDQGHEAWIRLLKEVEAKYELCTHEEALTKTGGENALCVGLTDAARALHNTLPEPKATVLAYLPTHPTGEVLVDVGTYFNARQLITLMA